MIILQIQGKYSYESKNIILAKKDYCIHVSIKSFAIAFVLLLFFCQCFWKDRQKLFPAFHLLLLQARVTSILG